MSCVFSKKVSLAIISVVAILSVFAVTVLLIFELSDLASGKFSSENFDFELQTVFSYNRLLKNYFPVKQHISLTYFAEKRYFKGSTTIELKSEDEENYNQIRLFASNITIQKIDVRTENASLVNSFKYLAKHEVIIIRIDLTERELKLFLIIEYSTQKSPKGAEDFKNKNQLSVVTFFQPSNARTIFPSFDEPNFRTIFSVDVHVANSTENGLDLVLFNAAEKPDELASNSNEGTFKFLETVPIPSYLVGFAILKSSEYSLITSFSYANRLPIRVFSVTGLNSTLHQQLRDSINFSLDYCEKIFHIGWRMSDKLDILLTWRFAGGMEQPGLIPISASYVEKPVALIGILIHELVHQWTGKLRLYTALIKSHYNFPF